MLIKQCILPFLLCAAFTASALGPSDQVKQTVKDMSIQEENCGYTPGLKPSNEVSFTSKYTILVESKDKCARAAYPLTDKSEATLREHYKKFQSYYEAALDNCLESNPYSQSPTIATESSQCDRYDTETRNTHKDRCDKAKEALAVAQKICNSAYTTAGKKKCKMNARGIPKCSPLNN